MVKIGSSDYKNVSKRRFFKEPLTECSYGTKNGSSMASLEAPFEAPLIFKSVYMEKKSIKSKHSNILLYCILLYYIKLYCIILYLLYYY